MRLKYYCYLVLSGLLISGAGYVSYNYLPQQVSTSTPQVTSTTPTVSLCDSNLWNFVYHPDRLPAKDDCRSVKGVVNWDKAEPDGDYHIRLQLDDPNSAPVNGKNIGGFLVVEPICQNTPTQADAIQPCSGYNGKHFPLPQVGSHIQVTGFYTLDSQHGWEELHSVNSLNLIP